MDIVDRAWVKKLFNGLSSGYVSSSVTDNADGSKTLTINFVNGDKAQVTFSPVKGDKGDTGTGITDIKITVKDGERHLIANLDDGTSVDCGILPNEQYDDTDIKNDISTLQAGKVDKVSGKSLIDDSEIARLANVDNYDDSSLKASINTVANGLMASAGYSADYKKIEIVTKAGDKKEIDVAPIISHATLGELSDIDSTDKANGKTLVYNSATGKHEYKDSVGTDELVKMDSTGDSKYLSELIDKSTIQNDNGVLKAKNLDGLEASITELNYVKGLTMPIEDVIKLFANGGLKTIDTPFATYADLSAYDVSTLLDDIRYLVRVLDDETHDNKVTAYLIKKDSTTPTFYGYLSDSRDFTTNPIDLVTEITGKLQAKNIDTDDLFKLLTLVDTYKTLTTNNEIFGTHGANAMYNELVGEIGNKANADIVNTHINDTDIHVSTTDKDTWNTVTDKANQSDLTSHTGDTYIHITSNERTTWNNKIDKASISTNIDSTSTNEQVAGAKAIYEKIQNANEIISPRLENIDVLEYAENTVLENKDVIHHARIQNGTNAPYGDGSNDLHYDFYRVNDTNFIRIIGIDIRTNNIYQIMKKSGTWGKWQRVCTTSVADVGLTNITFSDETNYKIYDTNATNYEVHNGICYLQADVRVIANSTRFIDVASGLPIPKTTKQGLSGSWSNENNIDLLFKISTKGILSLAYGKEVERYLINISYPVAES